MSDIVRKEIVVESGGENHKIVVMGPAEVMNDPEQFNILKQEAIVAFLEYKLSKSKRSDILKIADDLKKELEAIMNMKDITHEGKDALLMDLLKRSLEIRSNLM